MASVIYEVLGGRPGGQQLGDAGTMVQFDVLVLASRLHAVDAPRVEAS